MLGHYRIQTHLVCIRGRGAGLLGSHPSHVGSVTASEAGAGGGGGRVLVAGGDGQMGRRGEELGGDLRMGLMYHSSPGHQTPLLRAEKKSP